MKISRLQRDIIIGTILGDGYIQKTGEKNARLRLEHGAKQKDYLWWKVNNLSQFFQGKPKYLERIHPITNRTYKYWRHQSQSVPYFGKLRKLFYHNGKKIIPDDLESFLTARSLAVWYMDDGYYYAKDRNAYIYLGNVIEKEAKKVQMTLSGLFGLETRVYRKKKGYAIFFPPNEVRKLKILIQDYILDQFKYKLPFDPVTT